MGAVVEVYLLSSSLNFFWKEVVEGSLLSISADFLGWEFALISTSSKDLESPKED